jgi:hypothetical protein
MGLVIEHILVEQFCGGVLIVSGMVNAAAKDWRGRIREWPQRRSSSATPRRSPASFAPQRGLYLRLEGFLRIPRLQIPGQEVPDGELESERIEK